MIYTVPGSSTLAGSFTLLKSSASSVSSDSVSSALGFSVSEETQLNATRGGTGLDRPNHARQMSGCVLSIRESAVPTDAAKRSGNGLRGATIDTADRLQKEGISLCYTKLVARRKRTQGIRRRIHQTHQHGLENACQGCQLVVKHASSCEGTRRWPLNTKCRKKELIALNEHTRKSQGCKK
jgi:hypothetical protein